MNTKSMHKGFLLLEFILYTALASGVLSIGALFYILITQDAAKHEVATEVDRTSVFVLTTLSELMHDAESVSTPEAEATDELLVLIMKDPLRSPARVTLDNGTLYLQEGAGESLPLSSRTVYLENLLFSRNMDSGTSDSIRIKFVARFRNPVGRSELNYENTYYGTATTR